MRKNRKSQSAPKLEMTPMIDVVFQLLIFFVFVIQPMDVLAKLSAERRSSPVGEGSEPVVLSVLVDRSDALFVNERQVSIESLHQALDRLIGQDPEQVVTVTCSPDSSHGRLLQVLEAFEMVGAEKVNINTL